jgi:hypothetical protein
MVMNPPGRPPGSKPPRAHTTESVRVTLTLTREDFDRLQRTADELDLTIGEVLQRSIATALFLQDQIGKGSKILIQDRDGKLSDFVIT